MSSIFKTMPGLTMPVAHVMDTLSTMWDKPTGSSGPVPSDYRASQLNLILHFGLKTTDEEARTRFDTAVRFGQRYPCRIVVLCPEGREANHSHELEAKLYSQCFIGNDSLRSMCYCEALVLGYPTRDATFLDDVVSIWLENDLPVYHWFNRVPAERIRHTHLSFIRRCRKVLYDSSVEAAGFFDEVPWPEGSLIGDLAVSRMLPVRQNIGQFLSGFDPGRLSDGLLKVSVATCPTMIGERQHLIAWQRAAIAECAGTTVDELATSFEGSELKQNDASAGIRIEWHYQDDRHFTWTFEPTTHTARVEADLGSGPTSFPTTLRLAEPDLALAEAIFFSA